MHTRMVVMAALINHKNDAKVRGVNPTVAGWFEMEISRNNRLGTDLTYLILP